MSINKAIVVGNLGRDPEIRALPSGQSVASFSIATTARFKDRNGEPQERTEWHRVVAFGRLADNCQRLLSRGRQVYVEGRLNTRQYQAKDGTGLRYRTESHLSNSGCSAAGLTERLRSKRKHPTKPHSDNCP